MSLLFPRTVYVGVTMTMLLFVSGIEQVRSDSEVAMLTESYANNDEGFESCTRRIFEYHGRNLLGRSNAKAIFDHTFSGGAGLFLADGLTGQRGGAGRVFCNGTPTVVTYYLGEPKTIYEVGAFSFNGDTRSNQDYEVRFFDNSANPGQMPEFRSEPDLSTGDKLVGNNGGGVHTRFVHPDGKPLSEKKADWVQFRIWRTYPLKAGEPAKTDEAAGGAVMIELEVFGHPDDVVKPSAEELTRMKAIAELPAQPERVERDGWLATLIESREAVRRWEVAQDRFGVANSGADFGPWHVLGPFPGGHSQVAELWKSHHIDLKKPVALDDEHKLQWQVHESLGDGEMHDLATIRKAQPGDIVLLCRPVTLARELGYRDFCLDLSADRGAAQWLPEKRGLHVQTPAGQHRLGSELRSGPGEHQLLVQLRADDEGKLTFSCTPQPNVVQPGGGSTGSRIARRVNLYRWVRDKFTDPVDQALIQWQGEDEFWVGSPQGRTLDDWTPGHADAFRERAYRRAVSQRSRQLADQLEATCGVRAEALAPVREKLTTWLAEFNEASRSADSIEALHRFYVQVASMQEMVALAGKIRSLELAVCDQRDTWGKDYPNAQQHLAQTAQLQKESGAMWERLFAERGVALNDFLNFRKKVESSSREILLANPVLAFDKLLLAEGSPGFAANWTGANRLGNKMVVLSPVRPDGELTTIHESTISNMDLHWDGKRVLFSDGKDLWEIGTDGSGLRRVSAENPPVLHYDACYLPNGKVVCVSNACEQAVPCTGGGNVGNLHIMDADGSNERRVTFDQDHDWNPTVLNDGRVLYTRWEYTDTPHYFTRLLFRMNPDGTGQMEYYGSNSYWPNAMYWPQPIPGHPTQVVCVVSGHHGVSRVGELVLLDPAKGRHEADGVVQRIPGYNQPVEPVIKDQLVIDTWPRFATPYPLAEPKTHRGAGKYFLVSVQQHNYATWDLYLVDIFDNMTPILTGGYLSPIPLRSRPMPPVLPSHIDQRKDHATVYVADIYEGPGLEGYPRGSIKQFRVGSHHYRFAGNGDTRASSYEGGWDVKKILGTVPVNDDGSAIFRVPANTPIFIQPLDEEGKAQQLMRSWFTAMPGEVLSCIGCHERQNAVPPSKYTAAAIGQKPAQIEPWFGPTRGFSFDREVQPVLDRKCVGCHNDKPCKLGSEEVATIDLRAKRLHEDFEGDYSPAYMELQKYVRRAGFESDYHIHVPGEFEADTSHLVKLIKKGHYNVKLSREEWERLYTWIDFNIPYPANWRESHRPPRDDQVERRVKYKELYAGIEDRDEEPLPLPPVGEFEPPAPATKRPTEPKRLDHWPFSPEAAAQMQAAAGEVHKELDLGGGITMKLVLVPAGKFVLGTLDGAPDERPQSVVSIDRPFYLGQFEVTNAQYALFDPEHDSGYIEGRWKDRRSRGTPINDPKLPVVRVTWHEAMAYCAWLSEKTGLRCTLPTEAQWEWAARAGSAGPFPSGPYEPGMPAVGNIADASAANWNYGRAEPGYNDGVAYTAPGGRFPANAWGLHDLHGNVAEWCATVYRPYPYTADDGREAPAAEGRRVVRGGSWNDTLRFATSAYRWRHQPHRPVYNVGFRVLVEAPIRDVVAVADQ